METIVKVNRTIYLPQGVDNQELKHFLHRITRKRVNKLQKLAKKLAISEFQEYLKTLNNN